LFAKKPTVNRVGGIQKKVSNKKIRK
jgi:hypothetical protein